MFYEKSSNKSNFRYLMYMIHMIFFIEFEFSQISLKTKGKTKFKIPTCLPKIES